MMYHLLYPFYMDEIYRLEKRPVMIVLEDRKKQSPKLAAWAVIEIGTIAREHEF
jgi:hypothetical protein